MLDVGFVTQQFPSEVHSSCIFGFSYSGLLWWLCLITTVCTYVLA